MLSRCVTGLLGWNVFHAQQLTVGALWGSRQELGAADKEMLELWARLAETWWRLRCDTLALSACRSGVVAAITTVFGDGWVLQAGLRDSV